jgi:hypothetical protein
VIEEYAGGGSLPLMTFGSSLPRSREPCPEPGASWSNISRRISRIRTVSRTV